MKVLFCTDGSYNSFTAMLNFSKWFGNFTADIVSVSDMTYFNDTTIFNNNKFIELCSNNVSNILKASEDFFDLHSIKFNNLIKKCGSAIDNILDLDASGKYDYIVMGSNGKKGIQKWLGSVSQDVAAKSRTSVYISKFEQKNKNVLFYIPVGTINNTCLMNNLEFMNFTDSMITLLSVYEMPDFLFLEGNIDSNWVTDVELSQQRQAKSDLKSVEKLFITRGIDISQMLVLKGSFTDKIIEHAKNSQVSLIAAHMKKNNNDKKNYSQSICTRLLEYSECDILIYKDK